MVIAWNWHGVWITKNSVNSIVIIHIDATIAKLMRPLPIDRKLHISSNNIFLLLPPTHFYQLLHYSRTILSLFMHIYMLNDKLLYYAFLRSNPSLLYLIWTQRNATAFKLRLLPRRALVQVRSHYTLMP